MSNLSAADVESGTDGRLIAGSGDVVFSSVSIDTRTLNHGAVFFAIRGPNQDGHRFVVDALSKGALGAVVDRAYQHSGELPSGAVLIQVKDTHDALKRLARTVRRLWSGALVAVTGSMGKTTTREFAAQVMQGEFSVYQTPGNYNNLFGLPLALSGLTSDFDMGLFEMGMSAPGEIAEMCSIAAPEIGILTNVAPVHLAFFKSLEQIAQAKEELVKALHAEGTLIYNLDDPLVKKMADRYPGRRISFGFSEPADVRASGIEIPRLGETRFLLSCRGITKPATIPFAGAHYVMNALPGVALGTLFHIAPGQMVESLGRLRQVAMRGRILGFKEGFTVIDDSYNSNPRALMQMIEVLCSLPAFARRILAAGEMLELGNTSDSLHYECGAFAVGHGVDMVVGIRGAAREIVRAAKESGMPESQARFFTDSVSAADFITGMLSPGDLLLVKGSRGVHTEEIVRRLSTRFEQLNV